jgi:hypothetical protein
MLANEDPNSIVGIVTSVWAVKLRNHVSIPGRGKSFSRLQSIQTDQGLTLPSLQ